MKRTASTVPSPPVIIVSAIPNQDVPARLAALPDADSPAIIAHLPGPARQAVLQEDHHDLTSMPHADVSARLDAVRHRL